MMIFVRLVKLSVFAALLSGCVQQHFHYAKDGLRVDQDAARLPQYQIDKAICQGETAKANLSQTGYANMQGTSIELVYRGCMAGKGYVVR